VGHWNVWRDAFRSVPRASLRVKLVAVLLCLLAAAAAVIVTVGASALRGQLTRQARAQLRTYANQFTSHPFQLLGTSSGAPGAAGPFDGTGTGGGARTPGTAGRAGSPGAARMAGETGTAGAASTVVIAPKGTGRFSIELRSAGGQWLLSAGPGTRPGRALPAPFAPVPARTGVLRTVPGVGGSYLVIAEPMHFQARRLVFGYGADDFTVTGAGRGGVAGTLVVGLRLAGIGQAVRRLALLALAVSAVAILIAGGLLWIAIRFFLRPVTRAAQAADAATAGMDGGSALVRPVPQRPVSGPAGSLNTVLSQFGSQVTASEDAAAAAHASTGQMAARLESVAEALRRPVSLLHGQAEHWQAEHRAHRAPRDRRRSGDPDRALSQVLAYAADAEALLAAADEAPFTDPAPPNPDKTP
jgi:hypothetical protein